MVPTQSIYLVMTQILGKYRKRNDFLDLQLWFVEPIIYKMFVHIKYKKSEGLKKP